MNRTFATILLALVIAAPAAEAGELSRIARAYAGPALQATFIQKFLPAGFSREQVERGTVVFGNPPMMRWSYETPERKVFVFDGKTSWFYTAADRQLVISDLDESRRAELPFLFLTDEKRAAQHYVVKESSKGASLTTTLTAKRANAAVPKVTVVSDARTHRITRIDYSDREGNRTTITFSGYRNASPASAVFSFDPPPGVDVVRN